MFLQLTYFQKAISILIILISSIICITYAHTSFATLTERLGFYGSLYEYYNVDRVAFGIFNLIIAFLSLIIITLQLIGLTRNRKKIFIKGAWIFLCMAVILFAGEIYLQMRFHGKG